MHYVKEVVSVGVNVIYAEISLEKGQLHTYKTKFNSKRSIEGIAIRQSLKKG
jgi:hypothetical protein